MLTALIRPIETITIETGGASLAEVQEKLAAQTPPGFDLVSSPSRPRKGGMGIDTTATFRRRDSIREIEADTMAALEAKVPDGWEMLSVLAE